MSHCVVSADIHAHLAREDQYERLMGRVAERANELLETEDFNPWTVWNVGEAMGAITDNDLAELAGYGQADKDKFLGVRFASLIESYWVKQAAKQAMIELEGK